MTIFLKEFTVSKLFQGPSFWVSKLACKLLGFLCLGGTGAPVQRGVVHDLFVKQTTVVKYVV